MRQYVGTGKYPYANRGDTWTEQPDGTYLNPAQPGRVATQDNLDTDVRHGFYKLVEKKEPTVYGWVDFDEQEARGETFDYDRIEECLAKLIKECDFLVTSYGTMYPTEGVTLHVGHRGPQVWKSFADGFDWYYRILGGGTK